MQKEESKTTIILPMNPLKIQGYNHAIDDAAKIVLSHCVRGSRAVGKMRNEILALKKEVK